MLSYAGLSPSSLFAGCVGAGAAAIVPPSRPVVALGTPASNLGPSGYPGSASVVAFSSSAVSGWACRNTTVTLASVSLFGGAVTVSSVEATDGKGTVAGLEIGGKAVLAAAGQTLPVEGWGRLTLGEKVGRLMAPLVLRLLQAEGGLLAGTRIAIAFSAAPQFVAKHQETPATSRRSAKGASTKKKHRRRQPPKPPPDFPASPFPFLLGGGLAPAAQDNPVVSTVMRYLGVPYKWAGASPTTGFDCSGLVKFVFARLGVSLPHYTVAQWNSPDAVSVPPNRLQPGDLVFFTGSDGTRIAPGHVGIYVGDGYLIDAPHTGSFVRIDSLSERLFADQYVGARRIVSRPFVARHLLGATKPGAFATDIPPGFLSPITIAPLGESLRIAAAGTALVRTASLGYWIWAGVLLGGLPLLLCAGALVVRSRRQPPDPISSSEASN